MRDDFWLDFQNFRKICNGVAEEIETLGVFEVADVLAQECEIAARKADRIFQFCPDRQNLRKFFMQSYRSRHVPSRPPYLPHPAGRMANDRIVATK